MASTVNAPTESSAPVSAPRSAPVSAVSLKRAHARRLREIHRSAGWPCADMLEVELLAAGLLERCWGSQGHETLRLTEAGIQVWRRPMRGTKPRAIRTNVWSRVWPSNSAVKGGWLGGA